MRGWEWRSLLIGLFACVATLGAARAEDGDDERPRRTGSASAGSSWRPSRRADAGDSMARREEPAPVPAPAQKPPRPRPPEGPAVGGLDGAAGRFDAALKRSRQLDAEVAEARRTLASARVDSVRGFDAQGLLQPTSRQVDGQKVHALIGREGAPVAFLDIPPGISTEPLVGHRVGVRGPVGFSEGLGARLIQVRDLEPLADDGPLRVSSPSPVPMAGKSRDRDRDRPPSRLPRSGPSRTVGPTPDRQEPGFP